MYYVYDKYDQIKNHLTWKDSAVKATIFGANGSWSKVVPLEESTDADANKNGSFFVIGCFSRKSGFKKIAKASYGSPTLEDCS